jgi:SAM-dependent methyltransferase
VPPRSLATLPRRLRRALIQRTLERHGETGGHVGAEEIGIKDAEYHEYEPSGWRALSSALRGIEIGPEDSFVDIGCGKGRVLLQATRRPFGRVLGVELSPQLAEQARQLVASAKRRRCGSVEVVVADVTRWEVPDDVTIAYAYNALSGESLQQMLDRLADSVQRTPRRLLFIYANPEHEEEVLAHPALELLERRGRRGWRPEDPRWVSIFKVKGRPRRNTLSSIQPPVA